MGRGEEGIFSMSGLSTTTEDLVGGRAGGRGRVGGGGGQGQGLRTRIQVYTLMSRITSSLRHNSRNLATGPASEET